MFCKEYKNMVEDRLYNWLFHYNVYKGKWFACHRDDATGYFNGTSENVVSDKDFDTCKHKAFIEQTK